MSASNISTTTIMTDVSVETAKKLKAKAAHSGKPLAEYVKAALEELADYEGECRLSHIPNKKTAKVLRDARKGKNIVDQSVEDLFKKIGE